MSAVTAPQRGALGGRWVVAGILGIGVFALLVLYFGSLWMRAPGGVP
ncbi:MAG: hypothetical protein ACREQJ_08395 [Candidatus Binatia bacterium]